MKVSGLENMDLVGDVAELHESDGYLVMNVRLTKPVGWQARAILTHKDLMTLMKLLLLKPSNLRFLFLGFGNHGKSEAS
jgi:hypothetical protein